MIPPIGGLVLYKSGPAKVLGAADKIEIQLPRGKTVRVRPKDLTPLHPGPIADLGTLAADPGVAQDSLEEVAELLADEGTDLAGLAELLFGEFTPAGAWACWRLLIDGLYFTGSPADIRARPLEAIVAERAERSRKAAEKAAWKGFIERVEAGRIEAGDRALLSDVEELALGKRDSSRVMKALAREQTMANAHALLLRLGVWDPAFNPYPLRAGAVLDSPTIALPELPDEPRRDLTGLATYAIDDEGNQDPDDALSLEDGRLWVHVADVAALVRPDSDADIEARGRGGTLYLPELTATMLPDSATRLLGLGLQAISPALSFGVDLDADGAVHGVEVVPSWIRAERISYQAVEQSFDQDGEQSRFAPLLAVTDRHRRLRESAGAVSLDFPEVDVKVRDGQVSIEPQPRLRSRGLVSEAMLMAGEAAAGYADRHGLAFPYATQLVADEVDRRPQSPAAMAAARRLLKPRRYQSAVAAHQGLGLEAYSQVTSPLRRYMDLVAHQQLRAHLRGDRPLDEEAMVERIGATDAVAPSLRRSERFSRRHWTLVWLQRNRKWSGQGVLIDRRGRNGQLLIPALALEVRVALKQELALDEVVDLALAEVDLPNLEARFRLTG